MPTKKRLYKNKTKSKIKKTIKRRANKRSRKLGRKGGVRPSSPTSVTETYGHEVMGEDGIHYQSVNLSSFDENAPIRNYNRIYYTIVDQEQIRSPVTNQYVTISIMRELGNVTNIDFSDPEFAFLEFTNDDGFVRTRNYSYENPDYINLYTRLDIDEDDSEYFRQREPVSGGNRPSYIPSNVHRLREEQINFFEELGIRRDQIMRLERTLSARFNRYSSRIPFDNAVQEIADDILENGPEVFDSSLTRYVRASQYIR